MIYGQTIWKKLRRRLEEPNDAGDSNWSSDEKQDAIDLATRHLQSNLAKPYLAPLLKNQTLTGIDVAEYATNEISNSDDIVNILVRRTSDKYKDRYAEIVKLEDKVKIFDNEYYKVDGNSPIAYIIEPTTAGDVKIKIEPTNAEIPIKSLVVSYYASHPQIEDDPAVQVLFPDEAINALLYIAESECWRVDNNSQRAGLALQLGLGEIEKLNNRYNPNIQ